MLDIRAVLFPARDRLGGRRRRQPSLAHTTLRPSPPQTRAAEPRDVSAAAAAAPAAKAEPPFTWGADMKSLGLSIGLGFLVWFLPHPAGITNQV